MSASPLTLSQLSFAFDVVQASLETATAQVRTLRDLDGLFADPVAYAAALAHGDPEIYRVAALTPADGPGDLYCAIARLTPGRVGREYFMTKGHFHAWRAAAEFYVGLAGAGVMLLEDEGEGQGRVVPLTQQSVVYVPGHTAHRTINTGDEPLVYLGIYSAQAGHDYASIAATNFRGVVIDDQGAPTHLDRSVYLSMLR
jgi:glucose-6-phosphate isomerase, archaeal